MSRNPDQKPKAIHDDAERLELVFKRLLHAEADVWSVKEKQKLLKLLNPLISAYRSKCVELGDVSAPTGRRTNGNGSRTLQRSA